MKGILGHLSETLECPVALLGGPGPTATLAGEALGVARFPMDELRKIDQIVVANEIAEATPQRHTLMKRHKIAAIVPFHPHSAAAASWMLLGESFSEHVYTPLDFKVMEALFARLADLFLDKQLSMSNQVLEARDKIYELARRLAHAWQELNETRQKLMAAEREISALRQTDMRLLAEQAEVIQAQIIEQTATWKNTLGQYVAQFEAQLIVNALEHCHGNKAKAARLLGLRANTLHYKLERYDLIHNRKK